VLHARRQLPAGVSRGSDRLALRLNGHWDEAEIDEWGSEIPSNVLDLLQKDLLAIRREHRATHKHSASPAEQPAASASHSLAQNLLPGRPIKPPRHRRSASPSGYSINLPGQIARRTFCFPPAA
jgi:hypothetical protein